MIAFRDAIVFSLHKKRAHVFFCGYEKKGHMLMEIPLDNYIAYSFLWVWCSFLFLEHGSS